MIARKPQALASESEIQRAYENPQAAAEYVEKRFASELFRLLHDRQVRAIRNVISRTRPQQVLEVAPGPGRITREMAPDVELTCLEYNPRLLRKTAS